MSTTQTPQTSAAAATAAKVDYDRWHENLRTTVGEDDTNAPWHQMAIAHLGDLAGRRVLEIGCGRGGFSRYLAERQARVTAADFSDAAVAITRDLLNGFNECDARVADIQAIPFSDGAFDLVISLETLEHVPDPDKGLRELVRVTRPGGRLIVTTPNYFGGQGLYRFYRERVTGRPFSECGQPINQPLTLHGRVRALKRLGCRVNVVDGVGHYLYLPRAVQPPRLRWLDNPRFLMRWLAAHSLTVATKGTAAP